MARFIEDRSALKKKKKDEKTQPSSSVSKTQAKDIAQNVVNKTADTAKKVTNATAKSVQTQRQNQSNAGSSSSSQRQSYVNNNNNRQTASAKASTRTSGGQYGRAGTNARESASKPFQENVKYAGRERAARAKAQREAKEKETEQLRSRVSESRNPRMLDTGRNTHFETKAERDKRLEEQRRQKSGYNNMASEETQKTANRAVRNTPGVAKESLKQVGIGHGKTAADLTTLNESAAIGSKIDIKSSEFQQDIEKRRKASTKAAETAYKKLSDAQERSEQKMQNMTKDAKGLEKAYYGALESGIGMATDQLLGPAWAASMMSRTYGNTRGKAQKEGATEAEDRAYSLLQGAKEVATEYLFAGIGLPGRLRGRASLSPSEVLANRATRNMTGTAANAVHAGIRLLGGTAEENAEEVIGWGLDPLVEEFTYKKNVRTRDAQQMLKRQSDDLRSKIGSEADARSMAAYLGSDDFIESNKRTYMDSGIGEAEAEELAVAMRDYLTASLSGNTQAMADIEDSLSKKLAGKGGLSAKSWSLSELMDTIASTTLLTMTTGLPGSMASAAKGAAFIENNSTDAIRALANTAVDFEDKEMSLKAQAMRDRMDSGKAITNTQAYDLMQGAQEQYAKDSDRQMAALQTADKSMREQKLFAPQLMRRRDGSVTGDEITAKEFTETSRTAEKNIRALLDESEGRESLTDTEVRRGSQAIAGFKTGTFTVDDANELNYRNTAVRAAFEAETGVDLSEYIVKDSNGNVDIPATNAATKNALFAMAADNLVVSARAETANWMDNTKGQVVTQVTQRMGAKGSLALQEALDDVDERDRASYMMNANAADMMYQNARNLGTEWSNVRKYATRMFPEISESKLKAMYEAGLADRDMALDTARGQQIEIGTKVELSQPETPAPTGQVLIETAMPVKGTTIRTFSEIASNLGVDIHFVDHFTDENGNVMSNVNGEYINGNIYINVNSDFEKNMGYIFMHEVTHHLKKFAPEQYTELENLVREKWFGYDPDQMQNEIARKIAAYARHNQTLTEEQALEEIIADAAHEFINDPNFARQVADENPTLAKAVLNSIRNALRMLRQIMATGSIEDDTHMNTLFSQLGILDEAERLWLDAYTQAAKNKAAVDVDRLQNQIYEEGRLSVSENKQKPSRKMSDRWENGEKLTHSQFNSWYSAHKLTYGRANSENVNEVIDTIKNNGFISTTAIANVVPASINDFTDPNKPDVTQSKYGAKKGDVVMLVPRPYVDLKSDIIKNGFKPRDYEIVTVERDYQSYYELYEKAYDDAQESRYSISEADVDKLDMTNSTVEDENGDMVAEFQDNGSVRFSVSSFEKSGRQIYQDYLNKQVKNGNLSRKEADDMLHELETVYGIAKEFADKTDENGDPVYLPYNAWSYADVVTDENGKPVFSAIKKNSEYKMNIDFSTICKKRRTLDAVFREMINRGMFEKLDLNKDESAAMVVNINNLIRQHKFEAACALCFVEARRYRQQQTATTFRDMWNGLVESMYTGNNKAAYFNFGEDSTVEDVPDAIHTLDDSELDLTHIRKLAREKDDKGKLKQTAEAKAARLLLNDPSQRKLMRVGDMMASTGFENMQIQNPELMKVYNSKKGTGGAKSSFGDVQYLNEILKPRTFGRMAAYAVSGVRIQSFSDYVPRMVFDYVQVIADLAAKKLPAHGYTKEPLFVKQFGLTGAKINMSLVPDVAADGIAPGLDKDGNYLWNEEGTFPYDEAMAIQQAEGYKENCGTIAVGISDKHIMMMLADPTIQMVIPYHKSSLNPIVAAMTNVDRFKDYTEFQNTKDAEGKTVAKDFEWDKKLFRLSHDSKGNMLPKEQWGNVQDLVKEYAEWCEKHNYTPKFETFLYQRKDNEPDGEILTDDNGNKLINPGYYKLLEDFALLDNDGNFKPQGDVQMRFPTESDEFGSMKDLIAQGLSEDAELEAKRSNEISNIVDEIDEMFNQGTLTEQSATSEKLATRMSLSVDLDEPYMQAVNSGNMKEAQRLVDEAAKRAMPDTKFKGNWYHGTENEFTEFNFSQGGKNGHAEGFGIYITNDPEISKQYGNRLIKGFANVKRPASALESQTLTKAELRRLIKATVENEAQIMAIDDYDGDAGKAAFDTWISNYTDTYYAGSISKAIDEVIDSITSFNGNDMDIVQEIMTGMGIRTYDEASKFYDLLTETTGIDAFETKWGDDSEMADPNTPTIAVVFRSSQVKSADPVTYAEDGSVIPLSERFDPTNNDIRYSLPTQDADGNILSDGQMEFFKNSQARDEQGRLVPVYHTTNKGGFTVFDPMRSDDHRSLFFSDDWYVSQTYGEYANSRFYNYDINTIDDVKKYLDVYSPDRFFVTAEEFEQAGGYEADLVDFANASNDRNDFEEYLKAPEGYIAIVGVPDYSENHESYADDWTMADSPDELVRVLHDYFGRQQITYTGSSTVGTQHGYYACYLNLENPMIIDARGQNWNHISVGELPFDEGTYFVAQPNVSGGLTLILNGSRTVEVEKDEDEIAKVLNEFFDIDEFSQEGFDIAHELLIQQSLKPRTTRFDTEDLYPYFEIEAYDTRGWAEIAEEEGYDGVIFRNLVDLGSDSYFDGESEESTVYIAFRSNQVKDTRNTNPTEDPDIRWSIPEDEANSKIDYNYATSDSYEMLEMYEEMLSDQDFITEFVNATDEQLNMDYFMKMLEKYGKADKKARKTGKAVHIKLDNTEEAMDAFYSSLVPETHMVYDDVLLEEGRMRMAASKQDFWNNLNTKWNDRWVSGGEVLEIKSVKKDVRNLVMGVMDKAVTDKKYDEDLVNKTLVDMRFAYQLMKQGRSELASALLYHSALRMIENTKFIEDDTAFREYRELRDYLRNTRISFSERYWSDAHFNEYRKRNMGRIKLVKGKNNIDKGIYSELERQWPQWFGEQAMADNDLTTKDIPSMMEQLDYVLNLRVDPVTVTYSSEDCASWAFDIANDLYDIMEKGEAVTSLADEYVARNEANVAAERAKADNRVAKEKEKAERNIAKEKARTEKAVLTAKEYKEKYEAKARAMKVRQAEALLRIRKARDEGIAKEKARFKEYREEQKEKKLHSKYFDSIAESHKKLSERLLTNTKDKHIPEQYKKALARLLAAFDLQTVGSKKVEARRGAPGKKTIKMQALKTALHNIEARSSLFHVNDSITDIIEKLLGMDANGEYKDYLSVEGKALDELNSTELKQIDDLLKALIHEFNNYETVRVGIKRQQAADIGSEQIKICLGHVDAHGEGRDWNNLLGAMDKILNLDEVTPAYMFRMIDRNNTGIGLMFKELRRSFNRYVQNQKQINEWMDDILGEYHNNGKLWNKYGADQIRDWRLARSAKDFQLESGRTISLTPAQMMSIYCLSNREQAVSHMKGAGIVVQPVTYNARLETDLKRKADSALPAQLTDTDIQNIKSKLTPEQIKVATDLQQLMATKMAEWGNEASMAVIGIRLFEDPDYFPIKSDKAALEKDFTADQFAQAIRSFGFTKAVQPGASNSIAVDDIFDVVAEHCNQMNLYNSYSESMNDFMKVYNYHEVQPTETGYSDYSVEQAIATAFSKKATTFIGTFMKDLNGNVGRDRTTGIESMMNDLLARAKKASVFANGRVALQQPTAITRAFAVIDPKYLSGVSVTNATMREMFEHSSIALWKSWGYYDINMGKSIEDLIMNEGKWSEDMMTDLYGKLDNRTWTAIWGMCKAEIEDKHKDVKVGSDEYWELVSERMDEVVDLTQVVDSPFHRSHAMRSKNTLVKMFTAFMAEPTLTFNMVRDGIIRAREETQLGNKGNAVKILGRTMSVFALSAATTAAAESIWDVLRGKDPGDDDDEDKSKWDLWLANFFENLKDNINLVNNIYYVKDIVSIFQGWDQKNLGLQGFKYISDCKKQLMGEKVYSKLSWWENALAGIGYISGQPFKTIESDAKAIWKFLGLETPGPVSAVVDYLDSMSLSDMNNGESSTAGAKAKSSGTKAKSDAKSDKPSTSASVKWWTYETAPFHVEDGSFADNILNRFGINLTSAEIAAIEKAEAEAEHQKQIDQIKDSLKDYTGAEYDKHLWDKGIMEGYGKAIEDGDFDKANEIEALFIECGGSQAFIDDKKLYHYSKNYVKTIVYDPTSAQIEQQTQMKNFLLSHGVTEQELSEKVYKSQTAKELKVAFRIGDEDAMVEELVPLIRAGLSEEDYNRLWNNRNRLDIKKYKESGGKYADRLKSTGTYNWPITGTITSNFGHRSSPGGIGSTNHQGLDIAGSMGDPVNASDGGTVIMAKWYGGAGKTVQIQHDDGTITQYSHLSWWDVKPGDIVAQGQYIGKVGSTGNSTGPHLHFGVIKDGNYVDPSQYLQG